MGILSDIIDGIQKADAMPIGLVLGKSARPALDAGLKLKLRPSSVMAALCLRRLRI